MITTTSPLTPEEWDKLTKTWGWEMAEKKYLDRRDDEGMDCLEDFAV